MLVPIFAQSICIIFLLQHKYSAPLQHKRNWCQPPLPTARRPSRANGGAPVLAPANVGPSIPLPSHQRPIQYICPIQKLSNQPVHKIQFLLANPRPVPMRSIQCNPVDTIQPIRSSQYYLANTIQTIQPIRSIRYDQASVSSEGNPPTRPSLIRKTHPHLPQLLIFHPPHRPLLPDMCSLPLLFHLLITSLLKIEIAPSPRPFFWPF